MWRKFLPPVLVRQLRPACSGQYSLIPVSRVFGLDRGKPVDRYYIEKFLSSHASMMKGSVLEVGGLDYTRMFAPHALGGARILDFRRAADDMTVVADLSRPDDCPAEIADCFVCTHTFNFIFDVAAAARSSWKLLKPGGTLLATVAAITQISQFDCERWGDYWRFTPDSVRRIFQPVFGNDLEISSFGNLAAAIALLRGEAVEDLPDLSLLGGADPDYPIVIALVARKAGQC